MLNTKENEQKYENYKQEHTPSNKHMNDNEQQHQQQYQKKKKRKKNF